MILRIRPVLAGAMVALAVLVNGCGEVASTTTATPLSSSIDAATEDTSTTSGPMAGTESTTPAPPGPTVAWQETLALGSDVAVRHIAVSNGLFLALAEADMRRPGEVMLSAYVSGDGATWTPADLPSDIFADVVLIEFAGGPAGFIGIGSVIGGESGSDHLVWTSPDGSEWTRTELEISVTEATSPYVITVADLDSVGVSEDAFLVAGKARRYLDTMAIVADHRPDFEWPEFAYLATEILDSGDVQLTIGGTEGNDFVTTFSSLGIDPEEFPVSTMESDWFSVPLGSLLWTSTDGIEWIELSAPEMGQSIGGSFAIDATALGLYAHDWEDNSGAGRSWHSADGSDWIEVEIPGRPVVDWSGGLYALDTNECAWISADGLAWSETTSPTVLADTRELQPATGTSDSVIAIVGVRPDGTWQDATVPETWVAVSTDGETWYEAAGIEAFGMPIWPEAIASSGDRVVLGLVGEPPSAIPQTYLWLGTVDDD